MSGPERKACFGQERGVAIFLRQKMQLSWRRGTCIVKANTENEIRSQKIVWKLWIEDSKTEGRIESILRYTEWI